MNYCIAFTLQPVVALLLGGNFLDISLLTGTKNTTQSQHTVPKLFLHYASALEFTRCQIAPYDTSASHCSNIKFQYINCFFLNQHTMKMRYDFCGKIVYKKKLVYDNCLGTASRFNLRKEKVGVGHKEGGGE